MRKIFVSSGLLFGLISGIGLWFFSQPVLILFFRSMAGVAAASWVAYTVLFSSYFSPDSAPKAIGFLTAVTTFGQVSAIYLGGIVARSKGDRFTFLLAACAGVVGLICSIGVVENRDIEREPIRFKELISVGKDRHLLWVSILAIFAQFIMFATVYGFTPVAAKNLGADSYQLGLLTTLSALPGVFAGIMSGTIFTKWLGEKKAIVFGFLISAATCIAIPYVHNLTELFITQIIGGFSKGTVFPLLMGLSIKHVSPDRRASAMGFFQAIYGIGMFAGPSLVGIIGEIFTLGTGFWITGLVGIVGALSASFYKIESQRR